MCNGFMFHLSGLVAQADVGGFGTSKVASSIPVNDRVLLLLHLIMVALGTLCTHGPVVDSRRRREKNKVGN